MTSMDRRTFLGVCLATGAGMTFGCARMRVRDAMGAAEASPQGVREKRR